MLKQTVKISLKCPKHPRYNPEVKQQGFHAGCDMCASLWRVYLAAKDLEVRLRLANYDIETWLNGKKRNTL